MPPLLTFLHSPACLHASARPVCLQLRSLDLSQNVLGVEQGNETATLAQFTGLECLKLANCRMLQARCWLAIFERAQPRQQQQAGSSHPIIH